MYVHNLSPFAIQFTETFGVRWYGLAYLAGFVFGYYAILLLTRKGRTLFKEDQIADFITFVAIGVLAGGRLGYCIFYAPDLFTSFDAHFPFWGVLKVNEGGMASHGGIMGVMLVCWLYGRSHKIPFLHCLDVTVFGGSLGFMFGRIANFINGELYGRPAPADWPFAVKFPQEMYLWMQKEFNRMIDLGPAVEKLGQLKTQTGEVLNLTAATWQSWLQSYNTDNSARLHVHEVVDGLIASVQHGNEAVREALGQVLTARYPSQLYQSFLEGFCVFVALCFILRKPQKPGVVSGWFGALYCLARIVGEQFRMPDVQIGFQLFGLTRGQWLSIVMLTVAIGWLFLAYRRPVKKL